MEFVNPGFDFELETYSSVNELENSAPNLQEPEKKAKLKFSKKILLVGCGACGKNIDISHKLEHHNFVQCNSCNEWTPTMNAPAGSKYVRCPCNCLLTCGIQTKRVFHEKCRRTSTFSEQLDRTL
eukprot:GFUD01072357.1.p1 GENE.GFUD01072357.1~~GFUD01072357.1.p1  ORF type:complete len:146 (-),score=28.20 GFUD01072357.1:117-491(-)